MFKISKLTFFSFFLSLTIFHLLLSDISIIPFIMRDLIGAYQSNFISICLFLFTILLLLILKVRFSNNTLKYINTKFFIPLLILFLIITLDNVNAIYSSDYESLKNGLMYTIKYFMLLILVLLLFSLDNKIIHNFLKNYIKLSFAFSIISIFTVCILYFDKSILNNWTFELIQSEYSYRTFSWPYYLSIINITETDLRLIYGFYLPMIYSWFLEPQFLTFFILPSLIFINYVEIKYKKIIIFSILLTLIFTSSFTTYMILMIFLVIYLFFIAKKSIKIIIIPLLFIVMVVSIVNMDSKSILNRFSGASADNTYLSASVIMISDNFLGNTLQSVRKNKILDGHANSTGSFVISTLVFYFYIISVFFIIKYVFKIKNSYSIFLLIFIVCFSLKDIVMYIILPNFLFLYLLFIYLFKNGYISLPERSLNDLKI